MRLRRHNSIYIYDKLVWFLLVWCVFQDFVLSALFSVTHNIGVTKVLFFSKDVILLILFVSALIKVKLPRGILLCNLLYFVLVFIQVGNTIATSGGAYSLTQILSSVRGLILLPTLTVVGFAVKDKRRFLKSTKKYYYFLVVIAFIGLIEFIADLMFGTKHFWMDTLKLNEFYTSIKGQPALIESGTPGNWYTDIGRGYRTQKRLISIWAAPLTAGFVLLMPSIYYTMQMFSRKKIFLAVKSKSTWKYMGNAIIFVVALLLTFTRQTILPYLLFAVSSFLYYNKRNRKILFICIGLIALILGATLFDTITNYLNNGSTEVHIRRLRTAISQVSIFGQGIASFGTRFEGSIKTESQYLTLIGQLGIIALPLYLIILLYPIFYCRRKVRFFNKQTRIIICSICYSGLTFALAGIISETVVAFTSIAQYYVLIGVAWGLCKNYSKELFRLEN